MIRVKVVGESRIETPGGQITPASSVYFALALVLCGERGRRIYRSWLVELFWPGEAPTQARHNLRQLLYRLTHRNRVPLEVDGDSVLLATEDVQFDYHDPSFDRGDGIEAAVANSGDIAVLPGYEGSISEDYRRWVQSFRERAEGECRRQLTVAIKKARAESRWAQMERLSRHLLDLDPLNETATLAAAEALAMAGSKARAVRLLQDYENEVGVGREGKTLTLAPSTLRARLGRLKQVDRPRLSTPELVGRDEILGSIRLGLDEARNRRGGVDLIIGPRGSGKTRLASELCTLGAIEGFQIVQIAIQDQHHGVPGSAITSLTRHLLAADGALGTDPDALVVLNQITGVASELNRPKNVGAEALLAALIDLLRALAWERPLLLSVDDVDRADAFSLGILFRALPSLDGERISILMGARSAALEGLAGSNARLHVLNPLSPAHTRELAKAAMTSAGCDPTESWLADIVETSTGVPWDVLAACEACLLGKGDDGTLSLDTYLRQRLLSLDQTSKQVLVTASILGSDCTLNVLQRACDLRLSALEQVLLGLSQAGFLTPHPDGRIDVVARWREAVDTHFEQDERTLRRLAIASALEASSGLADADAPLMQLRAAELYRTSGEQIAADTLFLRATSTLADRGLGWTLSDAISRALNDSPNPATLKATLIASIHSAHEAQDTPSLEQLLLAVRTHSKTLLPLLTPHELNGLRIVQLEVDALALRDSESILLRCTELLNDPTLTATLRTRVLLTAVKAADHINDFQRIRLLGFALPPFAEASTVREQVRLRYAEMAVSLAEGNVDKAVALANSIVETLDASHSRLDRGSVLLNSRIPFIYACDYARIHALLAEASDLVVDHYPSTLLAVRILDAQATNALESLELPRARRLADRACELASNLGYGSLETSLAETRQRLAVASRDTVDLSSVASRLEVDNGRYERARMFVCANATVLAARSGECELLTRVLEESRMHVARLLDGTPVDYPVVALAIGIAKTERVDTANAWIETYVKKRRRAALAPSRFCRALLDEFSISHPWA